jgi:integrase
LLAAANGHRLAALYVVAITSGMREGEILALHWPEVNFANATVAVVQTLRAVKGGGFVLEPPKSRKSRRSIDLPAYAMASLNRHRAAMLAEGRDVKGGPVFVTRTGNFYGKSNLIRQVHRPLHVAAEVPVRKFHALRHTHASMLLAGGRNIIEVSERLGHADPAMTLRVYAHLMPGAGKQSAELLDRVFGRA